MTTLGPESESPFTEVDNHVVRADEQQPAGDLLAQDLPQPLISITGTGPELPGLNAVYWASDEHQRKVIAAKRQIRSRQQ